MYLTKILKYWVPVILYALLIFLLSSISNPPEKLSAISYLDKILHLIEYAILGFLLYRAFINSGHDYIAKYSVFLTILTAVCYGFTDELHQLFVPNREFDMYDLLFDGLGAVLAMVVLNIHNITGRKHRIKTVPQDTV